MWPLNFLALAAILASCNEVPAFAAMPGTLKRPADQTHFHKEEMTVNKPWYVHYQNKFPGGKVVATETSIDVYKVDGTHAVAVRKNGSGQWEDKSAEYGCTDSHDLSPIPKQARFRKLYKDGRIGDAEEVAERAPAAHRLAGDEGRIPSEAEFALILQAEEKSAAEAEKRPEKKVTAADVAAFIEEKAAPPKS